MKNKEINAIVFDFDGTLFETMSYWKHVGESYLKGLDLRIPDDLQEKVKAMTLYESCVYFHETLLIEKSPVEIQNAIWNNVKEIYQKLAMPKKGVLKVLQEAKRKGIKMCIVTGSEKELVDMALGRFGLEKYFLDIFTSTSFGQGKNNPEIFHHAREILASEREKTWVVEDAYYAAKTAKNAGYPVVGVYDETETYQKELQEISDIYLGKGHSLEEMLK